MTAYVADQAITTSPTAGLNPAQRMGTLLWLPMLLMGLMVLGGAFGLGVARGAIGADLFERFDASDKAVFETLGVLSAGFGLLGVGLLLAAISFALVRLAGVFRRGGASIQEAAGQPVRVSTPGPPSRPAAACPMAARSTWRAVFRNRPSRH